MAKTKRGGKPGAKQGDSDKKRKQAMNRTMRRINKKKVGPDDFPVTKDEVFNTYDIKPAW